MNIHLPYEINVLTDIVIRQGGIITTKTVPTSNSLLRMSALQHALALIKSEFWNPEPVIKF